MPSFKMKNNQSTITLSKKADIRVCQNSHTIAKKSSADTKNSMQTTNHDPCSHEFQCEDVIPVNKVSNQFSSSNESIDQQNLLPEPSIQFQQQLALVDSTVNENYEYADTYSSIFETIISSVIDPFEIFYDTDKTNDAGNNNDSAVLKQGTDGGNDTRSLSDNQTCSISDYCLSEMVIENLPFQEDESGIYPFQDGNFAETNYVSFFAMTEQDMILPDLEDIFDNISFEISSQQAPMTLETHLYLAMDEIGSDINMLDISDSNQGESFDPQLFLRDLPELSDVIENFQSAVSSNRIQRRKPITLVLDLDETLVHSSFVDCDGADFTYTMSHKLKVKNVYVKKRPHLHTFLEKVAEMFRVVIFTASQRYYSEQLLNRLDPEGKLISQRAYRDSCIIVDRKYAKDLRVLGVDLAKIAIVDNTPEVFRLQVNNGIPIQSWIGDKSDSALLSLLPFLETLADAEDVRPLIAEKFGNRE